MMGDGPVHTTLVSGLSHEMQLAAATIYSANVSVKVGRLEENGSDCAIAAAIGGKE